MMEVDDAESLLLGYFFTSPLRLSKQKNRASALAFFPEKIAKNDTRFSC
jgi:hypothetical protein